MKGDLVEAEAKTTALHIHATSRKQLLPCYLVCKAVGNKPLGTVLQRLYYWMDVHTSIYRSRVTSSEYFLLSQWTRRLRTSNVRTPGFLGGRCLAHYMSSKFYGVMLICWNAQELGNGPAHRELTVSNPFPPPLGSKRKVLQQISQIHWELENNKILAWIRHGLAPWMFTTYVALLSRELCLNLRLHHSHHRSRPF